MPKAKASSDCFLEGRLLSLSKALQIDELSIAEENEETEKKEMGHVEKM